MTNYADPPRTEKIIVGRQGYNNILHWFGRQRIVSALPMNEPPRWIKPPHAVAANNSTFLADPDGKIVGFNGLWCNRILTATNVEDTRRI